MGFLPSLSSLLLSSVNCGGIYCKQRKTQILIFFIFLIFLSPRRVSPSLAWGDFHARSRFARYTISEEKWGTTRSLGTKFFFGFMVLSMSWFELCESRTESISPVETFRWSSPPCYEVSVGASVDCNILWPQSEQLFTLLVEETKEIYKLSPSDCSFRRNSVKFSQSYCKHVRQEPEGIRIWFLG